MKTKFNYIQLISAVAVLSLASCASHRNEDVLIIADGKRHYAYDYEIHHGNVRVMGEHSDYWIVDPVDYRIIRKIEKEATQ